MRMTKKDKLRIKIRKEMEPLYIKFLEETKKQRENKGGVVQNNKEVTYG